MTSSAVAIRHVAFEDLGVIAPVLKSHGYEIRYLDAGIDPITPETLQTPDVVVILGGPIGVYDADRYPFLTQELHAIRMRLLADLPTLGVCLGAQLIARALGADVRATGRTEIGYAPLMLTREGSDSILAPLADRSVLHWHGDQFDIPAGATRLAATPGFPNQAFTAGNRVLALQFHLEPDHTQIERWLIGHAHELAAAGVDPNRLRSDAAAYGLLTDAQDDDDGGVGGDGVGVGMKEPRRRAGGAWWSWCRCGGHSVVTSATAARALDSSTMVLLVA